MRQIRPSTDELKRRYARALAWRKMLECRRAERPGLERRAPIPANSEPWLAHTPRSHADCVQIATRIARRIEECKSAFPPTTSSGN